MGVPSVTKVTKDGVTFISRVDRTNYLLSELVRAALRDVAKLVRKKQIKEVKAKKGMRKAKRPYRAFQYWLRKREGDLVVGIKHKTWYGVEQELGTNNQPEQKILRRSVEESIEDIIRIEAQYLSAIEDELKAIELVDEEEAISPEDEE